MKKGWLGRVAASFDANGTLRNHWHAQKAPNGDVLVSAVQSVLGRLQSELHSEYAGGMQFRLNCIDFCSPTLIMTPKNNSGFQQGCQKLS